MYTSRGPWRILPGGRGFRPPDRRMASRIPVAAYDIIPTHADATYRYPNTPSKEPATFPANETNMRDPPISCILQGHLSGYKPPHETSHAGTDPP